MQITDTGSLPASIPAEAAATEFQAHADHQPDPVFLTRYRDGNADGKPEVGSRVINHGKDGVIYVDYTETLQSDDEAFYTNPDCSVTKADIGSMPSSVLTQHFVYAYKPAGPDAQGRDLYDVTTYLDAGGKRDVVCTSQLKAAPNGALPILDGPTFYNKAEPDTGCVGHGDLAVFYYNPKDHTIEGKAICYLGNENTSEKRFEKLDELSKADSKALQYVPDGDTQKIFEDVQTVQRNVKVRHVGSTYIADLIGLSGMDAQIKK